MRQELGRYKGHVALLSSLTLVMAAQVEKFIEHRYDPPRLNRQTMLKHIKVGFLTQKWLSSLDNLLSDNFSGGR